MKRISKEPILLTNAEVLSELKTRQQKQLKTTENIATIEFEVEKYLKGKCCTLDSLKIFMQKMKGYDLKKGELLQICNLRPTSLVEIYNLVEEIDTRFSETQLEDILEIVKETLID